MSAKTLTPEQFDAVMNYVARTAAQPARDKVIFMLSFKAGLRACEIAGLTFNDVTDAAGEIRTDGITIPRGIAKKNHGREIPMNPALYDAIVALKASLDKAQTKPREPLIRALKGEGGVSANTLQRYIGRVYEQAGFVGCSSHSGRRTFITKLLRSAALHDCSIKDVQKLAGHNFIDTTEKYVDVSAGASRLVASI